MGAWAISLMGILIVFMGLGILYLIVVIQTRIFFRNEVETVRIAKPKKVEMIPSNTSVVEKTEVSEEFLITEPEQIAAIAAVIAYMESEGAKEENLRIKSVKRLRGHAKSNWRNREALVYWSKNRRTRGVR